MISRQSPVLFILFVGLPAIGVAQLRPVQLYNGINRPLMIRVEGRSGEPTTLRLLRAGSATPLWEVKTTPGERDLAKLKSDFWPKAPREVTYLQAYRDGRPRGSALVFQPMTSPTLSRLAADGRTVEFVPDEDQAFAGFRVYRDQHLVLETTLGDMEFRLRPDCAPNTAFTIADLVRGGLYTNTIFHRVVAKRADGSPFVIQGGDPSGTGSGGPGFAYALEKSPLEHTFGVISIARSTDPNTNGCQIFVGLSREGTRHLDGRYASFGELVRGAETVLKIAAVPVGPMDRPTDPPVIRRARLVDAPPYGTGPQPLLRPAS